MAHLNNIQIYRDGLKLRVRFRGADLTDVLAVECRHSDGAGTVVRLELIGEVNEVDWLPAPEEELPF